jgi:hypothetical protein
VVNGKVGEVGEVNGKVGEVNGKVGKVGEVGLAGQVVQGKAHQGGKVF